MSAYPYFSFRQAYTVLLVADGKFVSAFCAASAQHFSAVFGGHARAEAVLVGSFAAAWLECAFHNLTFVIYQLVFNKLLSSYFSGTTKLIKFSNV